MLGIRLDIRVEERLSALARRSGKSKSQIVRDLIVKHVRLNDNAERAEAERQSRAATARGWSKEDAHWETLYALNDFDHSPPSEEE